MFDIENVVIADKKELTFNLCKKQIKNVQLKDQAIQKIAEKAGMLNRRTTDMIKYNGNITTYDILDEDVEVQIFEGQQDNFKYNDAFSDQQEIVCVSFIVSTFSGQVVEKIALTRSKYVPSEGHADKVFVCPTEKELLEKFIDIIGNKDYNMIMHFNGWAFDERVIMSRMLLYDLLEKYFKAVSIDGSFDRYAISVDHTMKISSTFREQNMFQIVNPLRFSFDVFAINKKMNPEAEKLESLSLASLLKHYGFEGKEDVSYQEISDAWIRKDYEFMNKVYDYCQFDSIQQVKLQQHLGLLMQSLQMSNLIRVPLDQCVFKAVSSKVEAMMCLAHKNIRMAFCDVYNPFTRHFQPTENQVLQQELRIEGEEQEEEEEDEEIPMENRYESEDKKKKKYLKNVGGEVICVQPGFFETVMAVDAESMYPAQKEANNFDRSCLLTPYQMMYILKYPDEFGIISVRYEKVIDMYSPYISEYLCLDMQMEIKEFSEVNNLFGKSEKTYRWFIYITTREKEFQFQQFFLEKKNMNLIYPFVFLRQGKQYSPKGVILTEFRRLRQATKAEMKKAKESNDQMALSFLDSKQLSIKVLMNSEYGQNDTESSCAYNMFESSLVTKGSRYMIQNCRDVIQSSLIKYVDDIDVQRSIGKYNSFIEQTIKTEDIDKMIITKKDNFFTNPRIRVIYQDTDSNYVEMIDLSKIEVIDQYKEDSKYIKTTLFGFYNAYFCNYLKASMNKYPLNFAFEGAFFHAWYITKKNYLGQKIQPETCKLIDGKLIKLCELCDSPNLSDYNGELIGEYLEKKHIKVTGLKIVKRNIIDLTKKLYLKMMQEVLQGQLTHNDLMNYVDGLILDTKKNFDTFPLTDLVEKKKVTREFLDTYEKIKNKYHPGIGENIYIFYSQPTYLQNPYQVLNIKKGDYMDIYKGQKIEVYRGHYLLQIAKNLLKFINNSLTNKELEDMCAQKEYVTFGKAKKIKVAEASIEDIRECFDELIKFKDQHAFKDLEYEDDSVKSISLYWCVSRLKLSQEHQDQLRVQIYYNTEFIVTRETKEE